MLMKTVKILVAVVVLVGVAWVVISGNLPLKKDSDKSNANPSKTKEEVMKPKGPDIATLERSITQILAQHTDTEISVAITDLQTNKSYLYGETGAYTAASINKLVTALAYIQKVERGDATMSQYVGNATAQTQIQRSLVDSDNAAWESFYKTKQVSCMAHNTYAQSLGLTSYDCVQNTISAPDVASLLARLYKGELANKTHTDMLLNYLRQANYREYIVSAIPKDLTVYHKVGYLTDRVHDGAIITDGKNSYVLVIFTKTAGAYDTAAGIDIFQSITHITNKIFLDK